MNPTFFYIAPVEQKEDVTKDRTDAPAGSAAVDKGWKGLSVIGSMLLLGISFHH